jgi:DNA-binding transcriptional regulator/RsmH inhibitor MraZ
MKIYEDRYPYKMDPKNRVSVPVVFRPDEEGEPIRLQLSTEHKKEKVIKVFTADAFQDKFRQIEEAEIPQANKLALAGALRMNSREATISSQGKLTVPKEWADKIGLKADGTVILAGRNSYFILCSEETFARIEEADFLMDDGGLGVL